MTTGSFSFYSYSRVSFPGWPFSCNWSSVIGCTYDILAWSFYTHIFCPTYICVYKYIHAHTYTHTHTLMLAYILNNFMHMYKCLPIYVCVCVRTCVCACVCVHHVCKWWLLLDEGVRSSGIRMTDSCELQCECWKLNSGPFQEHLVPLTAKLSLQPNISIIRDHVL